MSESKPLGRAHVPGVHARAACDHPIPNQNKNKANASVIQCVKCLRASFLDEFTYQAAEFMQELYRAIQFKNKRNANARFGRVRSQVNETKDRHVVKVTILYSPTKKRPVTITTYNLQSFSPAPVLSALMP